MSSRAGSEIAITGMACLFPGAPDLETFARNLAAGVDAISEVPPGRWDPSFYDPAAGGAADRFYCRRGGFVDGEARFDAAAHGIMPLAARAAEPDQLLALEVGARAFADAGLERRDFDRGRAGVILGRGNYAGVGRTRLTEHVRGAAQIARLARALAPQLDDGALADLLRRYRDGLGPVALGGDAIGLVPNLTASRLAHRLDLGGPAYTVDAACASALLAVDQAVTALRAGRLDVVLAGGVHFCHDEAFWSVFCQLGALSRAQQIRPFDRRADGILLGEGAGIVVLRRLQDAVQDGDRVYAVILGTGVASDGREASLMNPRVEGQVAALSRAWRDAGLDPATCGMVEAHGTATPAGDAAELETLRRVFGEARGPRAVVGSVKSMIGHTMPAAGAAGLIKAALALAEASHFPTLHCEEPSPALQATRFRGVAAREPWEASAPRRTGVNAFGFGGINAHVVLEEAPSSTRATRRRRLATPAPVRVLALAAATPEDLLADLDGVRLDEPVSWQRGRGPARLAVVAPTPERLARARAVVQKGAPWRGREGIFFSREGLLSGGARIAFVYPGVHGSLDAMSSLEEQALRLIEDGRTLHEALAERGISPALAFGHSIGEWTAMAAAAMVTQADADALIARVRPGGLETPGVAFAALGCAEEKARAAMVGLPEGSIVVSHDNCPHQVIVCGADASVDQLLVRLRGEGVLGQKLPFRSGFHSPLFAGHVEAHRRNFEALDLRPAAFPVWSATTVAPYPDTREEILALAVDHLVKPVRFRELVLRLHAEGVRVFVQVGDGNLVGFIDDILGRTPHVAIAARAQGRSDEEQLARVCAQLFVEGHEPTWPGLGVALNGSSGAPPARGIPLALGVPLADLSGVAPLAPAASRAAVPASAVAAAYADLLDTVSRATGDVLALLEGGGPSEARRTRRLSLEDQPWLLSHTLFPQPEGWPVISDRHPVVPMTTSIAFMVEEAERLVPGRVAVAIEEVQAFRWLAVPAPTEITFKLRFDGKDRVSVAIEGYAEGTVILARGYPPPPDAPAALLGPLCPPGQPPPPVVAERLYRDRWMFHGPDFQGVRGIGSPSAAGLRGDLEAGAAPGALLDNAGQLFGLWVMHVCERDRLAMPVRIERIRFHGPHPAPGARLRCDVRTRALEARRVIADVTLADPGNGRVWAELTGWEDHRFETDPRLWDVLVRPEANLLAEPQQPGKDAVRVRFDDRYRAAATREQLMRRYLGEEERRVYEALPAQAQRAHLAGRIAVKDAVRALLWRRGARALYPVEVAVSAEPSGRPVARVPGAEVRVSIAHKRDVAVAMAVPGDASADPGIDVEVIEPRSESFVALAFSPEELALGRAGEDRAELVTRLWTVKEAVGKRLGTGLKGNPRGLRVTDRTGERFLCEGHRVETKREGDLVIAWTVP